MSLSTISLLAPDPAKLREDMGAKTRSFFCLTRPVRIDKALLAELRDLGREANVRVCLHKGPESDHHDMVILAHPDRYYRPHRHEGKSECFHVIDGVLGIFVFAEDGTVLEACRLGPHDLYRVEVGQYHAVMPLSQPVIFHENTPGPFQPGDSQFAEWAPDGADPIAAAAYSAELANHFLA